MWCELSDWTMTSGGPGVRIRCPDTEPAVEAWLEEQGYRWSREGDGWIAILPGLPIPPETTTVEQPETTRIGDEP